MWLLAIVVAENVIAPLSKHLLNRPRPQWLHPIAVEHSASYPSGHASGTGMLMLAVALTAGVTLSGAARYAVTGAALVIGLTISLDRIFLGVHYLTDVVGGNLLGIAIAIGGWLVVLWTLARGEGAS